MMGYAPKTVFETVLVKCVITLQSFHIFKTHRHVLPVACTHSHDQDRMGILDRLNVLSLTIDSIVDLICQLSSFGCWLCPKSHSLLSIYFTNVCSMNVFCMKPTTFAILSFSCDVPFTESETPSHFERV